MKFPDLIQGKMEGFWDYYSPNELNIWRVALRKRLEEIINDKTWDGVSYLVNANANKALVAREILMEWLE